MTNLQLAVRAAEAVARRRGMLLGQPSVCALLPLLACRHGGAAAVAVHRTVQEQPLAQPPGMTPHPLLLGPRPRPCLSAPFFPRDAQNTQLKPHLPAWVLALPIRKLWLSNNQLHNLLAARGGNAARKEEWLARLTHVCMSSNALRELPKSLLEHGRSLVELDCAYNHQLQVNTSEHNNTKPNLHETPMMGSASAECVAPSACLPDVNRQCPKLPNYPALQISAKAANVVAEMPR